MSKKEAQPAQVSYFFGKGYSDLWNTIKEAWALNRQSIAEQNAKRKANKFFSFRGGLALTSLICIAIFGTIVTAMTSALHIVILFAAFLVIYLMFTVVWLVDRFYMYIHKISNACPYPDCQAHFLLPIYVCPKCGVSHTNLVPGKYGILHRTCQCGEKLPTTFFNGRNNLDALCPVCKRPLKGDTASRQLTIPVIGGPAVGKTCLINMAIDNMVNNVAPKLGWNMDFISDTEYKQYNTVISNFKKGIVPNKTDEDALTACQLMIKLPNSKVGRRLYIDDISGEMFSDSGTIQHNNAFSYADGFVFLIDPLTIPDYNMKVIDKVNPEDYGASTKDFDDIFDIMLSNLQVLFGLKPSDVLKKNLAVVINKGDIPGLSDEIGDAAAENYMKSHKDCKNINDAKNAVCKNFLVENGEGNFVREADEKFKKVQYFTCSALGHNKTGKPFEGKNTEKPFLWIMNQIDPKLDLAKA